MVEPYIYVINLKHRTDRKRQFLNAWKKAQFPLTNLHWFNAINGLEISPTQIKQDFHTVAKTERGRAGRYGAFLSHTQAIATAIKHNHFPLLILEDDAIPVIRTSLEQLFRTAPTSANLLYFGALPVHNRKHVKDFCNSLTSPVWINFPSNISLYGGHAYGFHNPRSAQEVLDFLEDNRITFDSALVRFQKKYPSNVAVLCPFVFRQSEGYSDIEGTVRWK